MTRDAYRNSIFASSGGKITSSAKGWRRPRRSRGEWPRLLAQTFGPSGASLRSSPGPPTTIARFVLICLACALCGCQQKMATQPSFKPLDPSPFDKQGQSARLAVQGTVARGHLHTDWAMFTGRSSPPIEPIASSASSSDKSPTVVNSNRGDTDTQRSIGDDASPLIAAELATYRNEISEIPIPVTRELIEHGQNRYMIYCVVCHDPLGTGHGKIVERGYTRPPSYHIDRLRNAPVGHIFRVVSEGYGSMPSYGPQIPARDRWAIVAFVRALQLSQHFPEEQVTPDERRAGSGGGSP